MLENLHWEAGGFRPGFLIIQNLVTGSGKKTDFRHKKELNQYLNTGV